MELQFKQQAFPYLDAAVRECRNTELTQEIRLPDGLPDIGHILCAWGQTVLRGKEWQSDSVSFSGGMMVWVLYASGDGSGEQCIEGWIPFQMRWDLPENCPEGKLRVQCIPRFVDARSASARKIMIRAGVAAQAEAYVPGSAELWEPEKGTEDVELLLTRWPVRMNVEAGEKSFLLDEEPELAEAPDKLVSFRLEPKLTEKRVLGNKLVFRGTGNLHAVCRMADGRIRKMDAELPFSQFAELDGEYGPDAQADVVLMPTNLELELGENGRLRFKGGVVAQYLISDKRMLTAAEDAYSPSREMQLRMETAEIPAVLESRRENIYGEQTLSADAEEIADISFLPDLPRQRTGEIGVEVTLPGQFQLLYYGTDGVLRAGTARWEGHQQITADPNTRLLLYPGVADMPRAVSGNGQLTLSAEMPVDMIAVTNQSIPMVAGVSMGEIREKDPDRPSLILRRAGEDRLWDIAKASGSTMDAIRRVNGITEEPAPERMLLIPIP